MSLLTEALERILNWLVKNNPELALSLQPGLAREEISEKVKNLPFQLPEEVYQLYQWRNGDGQWDDYKSGLLPGYSFIPLDAALTEYAAMNQYREDLLQYHEEEVWQNPWFPILMLDPKEYLFIPGEVEAQQTAPVFHTQNLQDLDVIVRDITLGAIIKVKHEKFVDLLILALSDRDKDLRITAVQTFREWKQASSVEPLIQTLQDVELDVRVEAAWTLGEMADVKAVEPLIETLKDENFSLRGRAVWALGEIGDSRAIDPLTQCLKDCNEVVRKLAQFALQKIPSFG